MRISIYEVESGFAAFVRTPNHRVMAIDAGRGPDGWTPALQLEREGYRRIDRLVISGFDPEAMPEIEALFRFAPRDFVVNTTVPTAGLPALDAGEGAGGHPVLALAEALKDGPVAPPTDWGGAQIIHFYNAYPRDFGLDRLGNLSVVTFAHYEDAHVVFPGALERAGWERLLLNPAFVAHLRQVNVLVASGRGRPEGCCEAAFEICRPALVVIADSGETRAARSTLEWYAERASGLLVDGRTRRVLRTSKDSAIHLSYKRGFGSWLWTEAKAATRAA